MEIQEPKTPRSTENQPIALVNIGRRKLVHFACRLTVQFLTDNTLGRIWYEMRRTKTALADRCAYLVRKPGEVFAPRAKKDPRDLRILDPACGSGHFLLYAFDLLVAIYEEAYADAESPVSEASLAGDLGILLKVEKLVSRDLGPGRTGDLFAPPEERIRAALARFLSDEGGRANTRRRLFSDDAAHGVSLLGVAEKKFDVVLMNPPFGDGSLRAKKDLEKSYPMTKNDLYATFVERGIELLSSRGRVGAITSRTGFFLSSFQKWREDVLLKEAPPAIFADLGYGVLDSAMVETAAYCLEAR